VGVYLLTIRLHLWEAAGLVAASSKLPDENLKPFVTGIRLFLDKGRPHKWLGGIVEMY
jgi:hypothetical protein